jgi:hypothetical protein
VWQQGTCIAGAEVQARSSWTSALASIVLVYGLSTLCSSHQGYSCVMQQQQQWVLAGRGLSHREVRLGGLRVSAQAWLVEGLVVVVGDRGWNGSGRGLQLQRSPGAAMQPALSTCQRGCLHVRCCRGQGPLLLHVVADAGCAVLCCVMHR